MDQIRTPPREQKRDSSAQGMADEMEPAEAAITAKIVGASFASVVALVEIGRRRRPTLSNTDGDPLELITATFPAAAPLLVRKRLLAEDGPAARINVRLPEQLKAAIEETAAAEGRSVNAWLVRAASAALQRSDRDQHPEPRSSGKRAKQHFPGWVR